MKTKDKDNESPFERADVKPIRFIGIGRTWGKAMRNATINCFSLLEDRAVIHLRPLQREDY